MAHSILRGGVHPRELVDIGDRDPIYADLLGRAFQRQRELRFEELDYLANQIARALSP